MASLTYRQTAKDKLGENPGLRYLVSFLDNNRLGNSACQDRSKISRNAVLLDKRNGTWTRRACSPETQSWEPIREADGQAIIVDYLDTEVIEYLGLRFDLDPELFQTHLAGCEQHYTGDWARTDLTSSPCLRSTRRYANFVSFDYRRPYHIRDDTSVANFNHNRLERCSLLRSYHWARTAEALFQHERYSVAWFPGKGEQKKGAIICICDPVIDMAAGGTLLEASIAAVKALPVDQDLNKSIISALSPSVWKIAALWNDVTFYMDHQVSALEDQLEHDFWDKAQNPISILYQTQRASRRLVIYRDQLKSMMTDFAYGVRGITPEDLATDMVDMQDRLEVLIRRADKVVQALLASIAAGEGAKASSLTAIALWFAPLSLAISLVSIDGNSEFGGKKYWAMAAIAVPLLLAVIAVANTSDKLMDALSRRRKGRAVIKLFKPEMKLGHGAT